MKFIKYLSSWSPKHFLGISTFMVMGLGTFIISQANENANAAASRAPAAIENLNRYLPNLNRAHRNWVGQMIQQNHCNGTTAINSSTTPCVARRYNNGDPNFNWNPYFNRIPPGTRVDVDIQCDASSGQFRTQVVLRNVCPRVCQSQQRGEVCRDQNQDCGDTFFNNPYDDGVGPFSTQPTNWLTSPGAWNEMDFTHFRRISDESVLAEAGGNMLRLNPAGTITSGGSNLVNELHQVTGEGRSAAWADAWMTNVIWVDAANDFAIHGSEDVTGYPASRGCVRLEPENAKALYDLARRVGHNNMNFRFGGYGPPLAQYGGRPACSFDRDERFRMGRNEPVSGNAQTFTQGQVDARNRESERAVNPFRRFFNWVGGLFGGGNRQQQRQPVER